ncbi:MAG TPA: AMP-binding protein [Trebonia sp.]|jgi:acyl-coenzyme A synthetase/AMP-(fatty) acid ligase
MSELLTADSFTGLIAARAAATGDQVMLLDDHGRQITFKDFKHYAERLAETLSAQGICPGSRVAWQLPTRISTIMVMAALARLGAVQAPVIPIYAERETRAAVATSGAEFLLVPGTWRGTDYVARASAIGSALESSLGAAPAVIVVGDEAPEPDVTGVPGAFVEAGAPAATGAPGAADVPGAGGSLPPSAASGGWVYFTSGSSGLPKGARHTDASLLAAASGWTSQGEVGAEPGDVGSMAFPVAHVGGIVYVMSQLMRGFPIVVAEAFDAGTLDLFRRHGVTMGGGSTVFYTGLLAAQRALVSAQGPDARLLPSLRLLKGGGAPCPPTVFRSVREEMGVTVAHDYGMTEVPMICVASPLDSDEQLADTDGRPIPGNEVRIVEDDVVLPVGTDGEIQVRGADVFGGYTDASLDASAFTPDGWFRTGDRGHLRPDGHIEVTGRTKDLIIRKGEKIAPLELETLLIQHPAVAEVAVVGLPDDERGERVCAVLTLRAGASALSIGEASSFLRDKGLMPQKLPEQVEFVDELPRTGLGKVAKLVLRDKFSGADDAAPAAG